MKLWRHNFICLAFYSSISESVAECDAKSANCAIYSGALPHSLFSFILSTGWLILVLVVVNKLSLQLYHIKAISGIEECGFEKGKPVITSCNRGLQASLLAMVLEYADETLKPRVYFGSIKELELRDPEIISSGHVFIP